MKQRIFFLVALIFLRPVSGNADSNPGLYGALSIVPGLGQAASGNPLEGLTWFITSLGLWTSKNSYISNVGFKLWEYNMYDAYRDAGAKEASNESAL